MRQERVWVLRHKPSISTLQEKTLEVNVLITFIVLTAHSETMLSGHFAGLGTITPTLEIGQTAPTTKFQSVLLPLCSSI